MKRTFKFRAKRKSSGEFVYGSLFVTHENKTAYITDEFGNFYMCDPDTIGQYIEKHDVNNKEAYEGDILENHNRDVALEIKWNVEKSAFMYYDVAMDMWFEINDIHKMEITGTIHDNLVLLNAKGLNNA